MLCITMDFTLTFKECCALKGKKFFNSASNDSVVCIDIVPNILVSPVLEWSHFIDDTTEPTHSIVPNPTLSCTISEEADPEVIRLAFISWDTPKDCDIGPCFTSAPSTSWFQIFYLCN